MLKMARLCFAKSNSELLDVRAKTMANPDSHVTIHMAASLDGFIARKDGRVDWMETSDEFPGGDTMDPGFVEAFLKTIDCYVMGSKTYETALSFEAKGLGWSYRRQTHFRPDQSRTAADQGYRPVLLRRPRAVREWAPSSHIP